MGDAKQPCKSNACPRPAELVVHWPGQEGVMCGPCVVRAKDVARALGFTLATSPIPEPAAPTHTPFPWRTGGTFNPNSLAETVWIWGPTPPGQQSGDVVAKHIRPEDADLIVRAVNAHEDLVALLRWMDAKGGLGLDVHARIRDALKKAGGP